MIKTLSADSHLNIIYFLSFLGLTKNTHFLEKVSTTFGKEDEIIVVCILGFETFRMLFTTTFLNVLKLSPVNSRDAKVARDPSWQHLNSALL